MVNINNQASFFKCLLDTGCGMVVVTDGRRGAFVGQAGRVVHCSTVPVEVVGTAGAGDAFASAFVSLTGLGWPLERALKAATINSASVVKHADTQSGLMTISELEGATDSDTVLQVRQWPM